MDKKIVAYRNGRIEKSEGMLYTVMKDGSWLPIELGACTFNGDKVYDIFEEKELLESKLADINAELTNILGEQYRETSIQFKLDCLKDMAIVNPMGTYTYLKLDNNSNVEDAHQIESKHSIVPLIELPDDLTNGYYKLVNDELVLCEETFNEYKNKL